jgi:methionine-rich copper-binding protein CopC
LSIFKNKLFIALCGFAFCAAAPYWAWAHAFPDHAEPRVGEIITISPARVRIWFDGVLEPLFCTLQVRNTDGQQVDQGDGHVDESDKTLLEVSLPALSPGTYRVFWSVVARDGHRTQGDYTFILH